MTQTTVTPAFTRRHYQQIADAIDGARAGFDHDGACRFGVEYVAEALSALFAEDNPRFNRQRFMAACGIEDRAEITNADPIQVAADWHSGQSSALYSISSTGGIHDRETGEAAIREVERIRVPDGPQAAELITLVEWLRENLPPGIEGERVAGMPEGYRESPLFGGGGR
jgi:hypothetical protein